MSKANHIMMDGSDELLIVSSGHSITVSLQHKGDVELGQTPTTATTSAVQPTNQDGEVEVS